MVTRSVSSRIYICSTLRVTPGLKSPSRAVRALEVAIPPVLSRTVCVFTVAIARAANTAIFSGSTPVGGDWVESEVTASMAANHKRWNHSAVALKGHFNWKMMIIGGCTESKLATCRRGNYVGDISTFDVAEHGIWSKLMVRAWVWRVADQLCYCFSRAHY